MILNAILSILILSIAIVVVAELMPGIRLKDFGTGIKVAVVYSIIHFLLSWLLVMFSLPFIILTLGLFIFVINGFLLFLTNAFLDDFEIDGCGTAILASILISLANTLMRWILL